MIDLLKLRIYFATKHLSILENKNKVTGAIIDPNKLLKEGFKMASGEVMYCEETKRFLTTNLYHPFESLPSHNSTLAFKIRLGGENYFPHIEIQASPAKIMQGHNAYGSEDLDLCSKALLFTFGQAFPQSFDLLDYQSTEVTALDVTYSAKLENTFQCKQIIKALSEISTGHSRSTRSFESTASWNYGSDLCAKIAYLKEIEVLRSIEELKRKQKEKNHPYIEKQLNALQSEPVQKFIKNAVRFEAKYRIKYFKRHDIPTNLFKLIAFIKQCQPSLIKDLWFDAFTPIFNSFEGNMIDLNDSEKVYQSIAERFKKVSFDEKGNEKISYTKAKNIYGFYILIKSQGFEFVRSTMAESTFYRKFAFLQEIMTEAQIRTLNSPTSNIVSMVNIINVDFKAQKPADYIEPKTFLRLVS